MKTYIMRVTRTCRHIKSQAVGFMYGCLVSKQVEKRNMEELLLNFIIFKELISYSIHIITHIVVKFFLHRVL